MGEASEKLTFQDHYRIARAAPKQSGEGLRVFPHVNSDSRATSHSSVGLSEIKGQSSCPFMQSVRRQKVRNSKEATIQRHRQLEIRDFDGLFLLTEGVSDDGSAN